MGPRIAARRVSNRARPWRRATPRFNGAAHRCAESVSGRLAGPGVYSCFNGAAHRCAESDSQQKEMIRLDAASMGPRIAARRVDARRPALAEVPRASMGPRIAARRVLSQKGSPLRGGFRFNGAAHRCAESDQRCAVRRQERDQASMGPRIAARRVLKGAPASNPHRELQWGRASLRGECGR